MAAAQPDVSAFTRLRFLRLSAYAGSELTYYKTYESERSVGHNLRARADVLLSRIRPFIGVGQVETRTRPNGEIDTRADRQEDEISGGLAFDLSPTSLFYGAAYRMSTEYEDAIESGVNLSETMTRNEYNYQAGMKTDLTPLLSMQLYRVVPRRRVHVRADSQRPELVRPGDVPFCARGHRHRHRDRRIP